MPSLAFWKSAKAEESVLDALEEDNKGAAEPALQVKSLDFDPGSQETGVFVLDEEGNLVLQSPPEKQMQEETQPLPKKHVQEGQQASPPQEAQVHEVAPEVKTHEHAPAIMTVEVASPEVPAAPQTPEIRRSSHPRSPIPSIILDPVSRTASDRSSTCSETASPLKLVSTSSNRELPRRDSEARRLHRPTELNLSTSAQDGAKPKTELEKRFDMMRNSKSQCKAALRSPTALLHDRLNLSPKKINKHTEEHRVFVPPIFSTTGCIMPGPAKKMETFTSASVRAFTDAGGRPAWWCKTDKLVVFDGLEGGSKPRTRTSKGLSIARRRGDTETIIIPMDCTHCQDMLNRQEWKYDIQVCKRNVCWDCKERCKWEAEQELAAQVAGRTLKAEGNRQRADSVLQDDDIRDEDMMQMMGIEQARPKSPIETVGGIAERLRS